MTKNFEELINKIYNDIVPLGVTSFYIKPVYTYSNREINIEVKSITDLKPALLQLVKEAAPAINDVSISFELYNDTFKESYHLYEPYVENFDELVKDVFGFGTREFNKKEITTFGTMSEDSHWQPVLKKLEDDYNVKVVSVENEDDVDFDDDYVYIDYEYTNLRGVFTNHALLYKSDLPIMAAVLSFASYETVLVLGDLSTDAQSLLKDLCYKSNLYVMESNNRMAAYIASKADAIICSYSDYSHINTWDLNDGIIIIDTTTDECYNNLSILSPLKERHYDKIDKIYYVNGFGCVDDIDDITAKTLVTLWNRAGND